VQAWLTCAAVIAFPCAACTAVADANPPPIAGATADPTVSQSTTPVPDAPPTLRVEIPGTALSLDLIEVKLDGESRIWFGRTEVPWELLDVFVHGLDEGSTTPEVDAVTRPSKPYISMDRGFGHHGYPAISVSHRNAQEFCRWLSAKTGRRFRLPTADEWRRACELGGVASEAMNDHAWTAANAERSTHPVGSRLPDAVGLCDMRGNAAEWVDAGDGRCVIMGGSYRDAPAEIDCRRTIANDPAWNDSDPQIPRSVWWLADGGFIGFRIVCECATPVGSAAPKSQREGMQP